MASVGGDMAGDDRDDFRIGALGLHRMSGLEVRDKESGLMDAASYAAHEELRFSLGIPLTPDP